MTTKDELIDNIKSWINIDNEVKILQKEIKKRREMKKKYTENLVEIMKNNEIDCFDINDGKLIYSKNKIKAPLSKKHLLTSLTKYYQNDKDAAMKISQFILDTREIKYKETIRRKINKKKELITVVEK
tara:strand:- start:245 stop:628 length:384 start_codon:yes stop_codon:yes gene_type:complete